MENNDKIIQLRNKLSSLNDFSLILNDKNLSDFLSLKSEILTMLDDNQKIRFNRIEFYSAGPNYKDFDIEDLPF